LGKIRDGCPALRLVMIPDKQWDNFRTVVQAKPDDAHHNSILFLALERGQLARITSPIHRYLLDGGALKDGLNKGYLEDLTERWLLEETELARHQRGRGYMGKLVELLYAEWLESCGAKVIALEALRAGPDIEVEERGRRRSIDVKYLGVDDIDFEAVVVSLKDSPPVVVGDLYGSINYVVFRVYEAAQQLRKTDKAGRTVAIVIDEQTWHTVALQLENKWIDWRNAKLYEKAASKAKEFLARQRTRYPEIDNDLAAVIRDLDEVRFLRLRYGFELVPEFEIRLG
jgi:hypothetical protein